MYRILISLLLSLSFINSFSQDYFGFADSITKLDNKPSLLSSEKELIELSTYFNTPWNDSLKNIAYVNLGNSASRNYDFKLAEQFFEKVDSKSIKNQHLLCKYWLNKAHIVFYIGNIDTSIAWYNKSILLGERYDGNQEVVCDALNGLALAFDRKGERETKIEYLNKLITYANRHGLIKEKAVGIFNIGSTYEQSNFFREAANNYLKVLEYSPKFKRLHVSTLAALGNTYISLDMLDSAQFYFTKANEFNLGEDLFSEAFINGGLGAVALKKKEFSKAKVYLINANKLFKKIGDEVYINYSAIEVGEVYMHLNELDSSQLYLQTAKNFFVTNKSWEEAMSCSQLLALNKARKGQIDSVDYYIDKYHQYGDSSNASVNKALIAEYMANLELKEKEVQLAIEKAGKERNEREKFIAVAGASALFVIVLTLVIFTFYLSSLNKKLKQGQTELSERNQLLAELNSNNDKFLTIMSHDVRGPIASLKTLLSMAKESKNNENVHQIINLSIESANNTYMLVDELLEWASLDKGLEKFEREQIPINQLVDRILGMYKVQSKSKNISLENNCANNSILYADRQMISTIIRNLVTNSIKFTESGGKISIDFELTEQEQIITVKDTGIGMSEEQVENFYHNLNNSKLGTNKEIGKGIGQKLIKMMIEKHKGTINIDSTVGKGTAILVRIPM